MDQQNRKPLTEDIREEQTDNVKDTAEQAQPVPVYAERAETVLPEEDGDELRALALSYARYLAAHDMRPGDPTFTDSEEGMEPAAEEPEQEKAEETVQPEAAEEPEPPADTAEEEAEAPAEETDAKKPAAKNKKKNKSSKKKASSGRHSIFTATQAEPSEAEIRKIEASLAKNEKKYARAG